MRVYHGGREDEAFVELTVFVQIPDRPCAARRVYNPDVAVRLFLAIVLVTGSVLVSAPASCDEGDDAPSGLPPEELVIMLREARIAGMSGDKARNLRILREATEAYPQSVVPIMALWDYHRRFELSEEEVAELRSLLTLRLSDLHSPLPPGTLNYLVYNADASEEELELVLDAARRRLSMMETDDPRFLEAVGVLQIRLGRLEQARENLRKLIELRPTLQLLWQAFVLDQKLERWEDAARMLDRIREETDLRPLLATTHLRILGKLGRYEELTAEVNELSDETESWGSGRRKSLGRILIEAAWDLRDAGKDVEAEAMFRRVLEIDPEDSTARLAVLYLYSSEEERREHEAAVRERRESESDPSEMAEEGATLLAAGDTMAAIDLLQRAAPQMPDSELVWFNLGLAALRLERWDVAESAFARAAKINPGRVESVLQRGIALQILGRCEEAIPVLQRALEQKPELTQAHYYLYACHHALGDDAAATEHLRLYNAGR